ncbi:VOC family protein [Winogradskya humida]|uniref:Glyoxalase-like domain-containing protein n=1 Tax=Winogradskya humida TaxID=113566 RepID=A0ABQ4A723_9ACTN|nr:VOC family protein [Actinoplanes humidus]GIE26639.1 hypothetical protein Ahu01nite_097410 [Actinoplanes humidus]
MLHKSTLTEELAKYVLPAAQFDGLSLEVLDAPRAARFWSVALGGGTVQDVGPGRLRIDAAPGRSPNEILRLTTVRELRPQATRAHLDLRLSGAAPDVLVAAGAQIVRSPGPDPWYVLADPEGNHLCAYPSVDDRPSGIFQLVVKCRDAYAQARWWGRILSGDVIAEGPAAAVKAAPGFPWDYLLFDPVPEPKVTRNRLHWHLDLRDRDPSALLLAGATILRQPDAIHTPWVLADPEGNEFCAFTKRL